MQFCSQNRLLLLPVSVICIKQYTNVLDANKVLLKKFYQIAVSTGVTTIDKRQFFFIAEPITNSERSSMLQTTNEKAKCKDHI